MKIGEFWKAVKAIIWDEYQPVYKFLNPKSIEETTLITSKDKEFQSS